MATVKEETPALEQLRSYKRLAARIKILEKQPVGGGLYIGSFRQGDQLQELDRQLRQTAGKRTRLWEVRETNPAGRENGYVRDELESKMAKVIEARSDGRGDSDEVIAQIGELQSAERQKKQIEWAIEVLQEYQSDYGRLLRLEFMESKSPVLIMDELGVSRSTLYNWRRKAIDEYAAITGTGGTGK